MKTVAKKYEPATPRNVRDKCLSILESFAESVNLALPANLRTSRSEIARALCNAREQMKYQVDTGADLSNQTETAETHGVLVADAALDAVVTIARGKWGEITVFPYDNSFLRHRHIVFVAGKRDALQSLVDSIESLME